MWNVNRMKTMTTKTRSVECITCDECGIWVAGDGHYTCNGCGKDLCENCKMIGEDICCLGYGEYFCSTCIVINKKYCKCAHEVENKIEKVTNPLWELIEQLHEKHDKECKEGR